MQSRATGLEKICRVGLIVGVDMYSYYTRCWQYWRNEPAWSNSVFWGFRAAKLL